FWNRCVLLFHNSVKTVGDMKKLLRMCSNQSTEQSFTPYIDNPAMRYDLFEVTFRWEYPDTRWKRYCDHNKMDKHHYHRYSLIAWPLYSMTTGRSVTPTRTFDPIASLSFIANNGFLLFAQNKA